MSTEQGIITELVKRVEDAHREGRPLDVLYLTKFEIDQLYDAVRVSTTTTHYPDGRISPKLEGAKVDGRFGQFLGIPIKMLG